MARKAGFIADCQTQITTFLNRMDAWSALKAEYDTFDDNGITIEDADVAHIGVTANQFLQALAAMQEVVDYGHVAARAAKIYRIKQ